QLLGYRNTAVFRGDGGEAERRPNKPTIVWTTHSSEGPISEEWPATLDEGHAPPDEVMDVSRLVRVWRGEEQDEYAEAAVTGTMAIALKTAGKAGTIPEAEALAADIWASRDKSGYPVTT
ncbi:MAG: glycosyl transferase, partial [Alphaproteobacteria bacterium]